MKTDYPVYHLREHQWAHHHTVDQQRYGKTVAELSINTTKTIRTARPELTDHSNHKEI